MAVTVGVTLLGDTWNRPTITGAGWCSAPGELAGGDSGSGRGQLAPSWAPGGQHCGLRDDKVLSGLSGGEGERSEEDWGPEPEPELELELELELDLWTCSWTWGGAE